MPPQIFIFPASRHEARKNYEKTMQKPVNEMVLRDFLDAETLNEMLALTEGKVYAWGATRKGRNPKIWEKMRRGDYVLAYRDKCFISLSRIVGKIHKPELAEHLWGVGKNPDNMNLTWEYIYFLEKIIDFDPPEPSPFTVRGHTGPLTGIQKEQIDQIFKRYEQVIKQYDPDYDKSDLELVEEIERAISQGNYRVEDSWGRRKIRIGQNVWREKVLERYGWECAICSLPIKELLDAAHIKSWAEYPDYRLDPNNGIALCVLHHRAFDKGLIKINQNGEIECSDTLLSNQHDTIKLYFTRYHKKRIINRIIV
jgi:hypothetical protein